MEYKVKNQRLFSRVVIIPAASYYNIFNRLVKSWNSIFCGHSRENGNPPIVVSLVDPGPAYAGRTIFASSSAAKIILGKKPDLLPLKWTLTSKMKIERLPERTIACSNLINGV